MTKISTLIWFFIVMSSPMLLLSQAPQLFNEIEFDEECKLVGFYAPWANDKAYSKYDFLIEDQAEFDKFMNAVRIGDPTFHMVSGTSFDIKLIKGNKVLKTYMISADLRQPNISIDGKCYKFEIEQFKAIAERNPLKLEIEKMPFESETSFNTYLSEGEGKENIIYVSSPYFGNAGNFNLQFEIGKEFPSVNALLRYLESNKYPNISSWGFTPELEQFNGDHPHQFTISIDCKAEFYEEFNEPKAMKKGPWEPPVYEATLYKKAE